VSGAVVAHTEHGAVSLVNGRTLTVRAVLHGFSKPRYTAAGPHGRYAYVTDSGHGDVAVVDVVRKEVVHRTKLGGPARHVSLDPTGTRLWVSLGSKAEEIALVDASHPRRPRLVRRIRPPFLAHDVGFTPDGREVWVTSGSRRRIAVYDAALGRIRLMLHADAPPQHVTFLAGKAFVASGEDGTLQVHDLEFGRVLDTSRIPRGSYNVQQGEGVVVTPSLDRGTLCIVGEHGSIRHRLKPARSSHDACVVLGA
jgi:DNA-binding beta-propeller fold protein YncE